MNQASASRRLLIVDDPEAPALHRVRCDPDGWEVLLLGRSPEWWRLQHPDGQGVQFVDPLPWAARAHDLVGDFLVDWVHSLPSSDLGGTTLDALLQEPEGSAWWWLETSEKGPYRGPLVGQLYRVALVGLLTTESSYRAVHIAVREPGVGRVLRQGPGWVIESDTAVDSSPGDEWLLVRHAARIALAWVRLFATRVALPRLAPRDLIPRLSGRPVVFTMFPAWWTGALTATPSDRFFGAALEGGAAGYIAWVTQIRQVWRARSLVRRAWATRRLMPLQRWARLRDVSWRGLWWVWRYQQRLRRHVRGGLAGLDVSLLLQCELGRALASGEAVQDRVLTRAMRRAADELRPSAVLYRLEWQPAEHAVVMGVARRVPVIGFMHYPFGMRYLSHRLAAGEAARALAGRPGVERPLPDGVLANGAAIRDNVTAAGYPPERVALCGPQRYVSLIAASAPDPVAARERLGRTPGERWVLVAPAILESDTEALAAAVWHAAQHDPSLRIVVRPHPNQPVIAGALGQVVERLGPTRTRVVPARAPLYDTMVAVDWLVCVGSMIAFEAMALGVCPIVFESPSSYAATSLRAYARGLFVVTDGPSLLAALHAAPDVVAGRQHHWPSLLDQVMGDRVQSAGTQMRAALTALGVPSPTLEGTS